MPGTRRVLTRIAFAAGLLLPVTSYGSKPASDTRAYGAEPPATPRAAEPESVRSALSALVDACGNWPQELPVSVGADLSVLSRGSPIEAVICDGIVDLGGRRLPIMMFSIVMTATVLGTFAGAFVASASPFRLLFGSIRQATFAARGVLSSLGDR